MLRRSPAICSGALLVVGVLLTPAVPAAGAKAPAKPSLKVTALSVNRAVAYPGETVKARDSQNRCYIIGGQTGQPPSLVLYGFVKAVKIPASAPTTVVFTAPWDAYLRDATLTTTTGPFKSVLYRNKTHPGATISGGQAGPYDFFRYEMLPTGIVTSNVLDGAYGMDVKVKVAGKTLHAKATIKLAC